MADWATNELRMTQAVGLVQIAFFVAVATVTVLTYLRATRTVFLPLRTEVFKAQMAQVQQVVDQFSGKSDSELLEDLDWTAMVAAASEEVFDLYSRYAFGTGRPKPLSQACVAQAVSPDQLVLARPIPPTRSDTGSPETHSDDLRLMDVVDGQLVRASTFAQVRYLEAPLTAKYLAHLNELRLLASLVLLPRDVRSELEIYVSMVDATPKTIWTALNEAKNEIPQHYPSPADLDRIYPSWLPSKVKRPPAELLAADIVKAAKDYLRPDDLL
jgi:hypothetical protein